MEAGKYSAKIVECGLTEDAEGKPRPFLMFETSSGEKVRWSGSLSSDKSCAYTAKSLVNAGYTLDSFKELNFDQAHVLYFKPQEIEIEVEKTIGKNGKEYANVKFINTKSSQMKRFQGMVSDHYKAYFVKARAGDPVQPAKPKEEAPF